MPTSRKSIRPPFSLLLLSFLYRFRLSFAGIEHESHLPRVLETRPVLLFIACLPAFVLLPIRRSCTRRNFDPCSPSSSPFLEAGDKKGFLRIETAWLQGRYSSSTASGSNRVKLAGKFAKLRNSWRRVCPCIVQLEGETRTRWWRWRSVAEVDGAADTRRTGWSI